LREALVRQNEQDINRAIEVERAGINERQRLGLFEQAGRFQVQAAVDAETTKWNKIQETIDDPKRILKIVAAIVVIALIIYVAKYGIPVLVNHLTQPRVISETSKKGWFGWGNLQQTVKLDDLTFTPSLQKKLFDLALRIKTAKTYNENLPNVLFYGESGTGKTAFAKALAYYSDVDYALTSGSEFAKITDLNSANNELRKLLDWAKKSDNGLIIFIDEVESLFANRKLPSTSKATQNFINTFLALVPDGSQKNVMFVFATNHPFKLDDAINDRIATKIEFTLPEKLEREKILSTYLEKFAQESEEAIVALHPEIVEQLTAYADSLKGLSPRAIQIVAEEMIVYARRQKNKQLTDNIARIVLENAQYNLGQVTRWEKERNEWIAAQG
jgi:AAA+ superfamily predicted ATPase